jgi:simple sugar transport system ATP-binding protein
VLTPAETDGLLEMMRLLKEQNCTIVFITHKLKEVLAVTDEVTIMRKGIVTGAGKTAGMSIRKLSELIVGREVEVSVPMAEFNPGKAILELDNVCTTHRPGRMPVKNISLRVHCGEIVGVAGVEGNGQSDLAEVITGMVPVDSGSIRLANRDISRKGILKRRRDGISHIPEDRLKTGVAKNCTICENLMLNCYTQRPFSSKGVLRTARIAAYANEACVKYGVKTPDAAYTLSTLSGGNMQKVVFAREIEAAPELLVAAQPTRGVDIGAIEYIHSKIAELRDKGKGILLVSAELDEVLALADRIIILYEGEIVAQFLRGQADEYEIGEYMLGAKRQEVRHEC